MKPRYIDRLWLRFTAIVVLAVLASAWLVVGLQIYAAERRFAQFDPAYRVRIDQLIRDPALTDEERTAKFRELFRDLVASEEDFAEFAEFMDGMFSARLRAPLLAGLAALPLGILVALLASRYISRPIRNLSDAAKQVARGDFSARAPALTRLRTTELNDLTHDFNQMATALERLESERRAMIADIAHELRTPLTILQGQLDALHYGVVPLDLEQVAKLNKQTDLLARLIKDLRTLSLADAGRLALERKETNLATLIEDLVDGFRELASSKAIDLQTDLRGRPAVAEVDPDRIAQVIINLLDNALRHTPSGGKVWVGLKRKDEQLLVEVRDSGPGLEPDALSRVFDRFYRADLSRSRASGGTGLGLAIAKAIIQLHGGEIKADNLPGGGARFSIFLN